MACDWRTTASRCGVGKRWLKSMKDLVRSLALMQRSHTWRAQGVVAGVGFLCAGTILKHNAAGGDEHVQGLTTAAGLWLTAAIGMACGLGREVTAIMSALLALAVFALIPRLVSPRAAANTDTDAHKAPAADRPG